MEHGTRYTEETIYIKLAFTGRRADLWVKLREPTTAEWEEEIMPLLVYAKDDPHRLTAVFCKMLHSWNLDYEDGRPVPMTREGFRSQNIRFTGMVLRAWINNAIVVQQEEDRESASTEQDEQESIEDPFPELVAVGLEPEAGD